MAPLTHRRQLADALVASGVVRSPWLRRAFEDTPREVFVPRFYRHLASGQKVLLGEPARRSARSGYAASTPMRPSPCN